MTDSNESKITKICFISPKAYLLFNPAAKNVKYLFGGGEVDLYLLAVELAKDKMFDVSFIVADYGQNDLEIIKNVRIIRSLNFEHYQLKSACRIWKALKKADAQIYFHEVASWGVFLVSFFCKLHSRTFIYRTAHQVECDGTYLKDTLLLGKALKWSLHNADQVITQNQTDKENLLRTSGVDSIVISNGQYLPELSEDSKTIILWVGRSTAMKRPDLFLKLAENFPHHQFVMICPEAVNDANYQELTEKVKKIEQIQFIPRVPYEEIGKYFSRAKLFICTSRGEGFPNTYIQACKYSTPILSLCINPDNFLNTFKCGICAEDDWEKFLKGFQQLIEPEKCSEYGRNARKYAEKKHDIRKIIECYKELFLKLKVKL